MRRAIQFCHTTAKHWDERVGQHQNLPYHVIEGMNAYAIEHADTERQRAASWTVQWMNIRDRARQVLEKSLGEIEEDVDLSEIIVPDVDSLEVDID